MGWLSDLWSKTKTNAGKALNFGGNILKRVGEFGGKALKVVGDWAPVVGDIVSGVGLAAGQPEVALAAQGVANVLHRAGAWAGAAEVAADRVTQFGNNAQALANNLLTSP
jgi:hypothetical protein